MVSETTAPPRRGLTLIRRIYLARVMVLVLGFVCIGSVLYELKTSVIWWVLAVLHGCVWPHLAYQIEKRAARPRRLAMRTLFVDNLMVGLWMPVMHFNLLPCAAIASMSSMSNVGVGGLRMLWYGAVAHAIGAGIGVLLAGFHWQPLSSLINTFATLPLILLYPTAIGALTYQLSKRLSQRRDELDYLSKHDGLSGLLNRMHWETLVAEEFARGQRQRTPAAVILADIDFFKAINDRSGHAAGDEVIRQFASLLRANVREIDRVARYGGEEFAILLPGTTLPEAIETAERLRSLLEQAPLAGVCVTASFGVAELRDEFVDPGAWVQGADIAMYRAKAEGRNRIVVYKSNECADETRCQIASRDCAQ